MHKSIDRWVFIGTIGGGLWCKGPNDKVWKRVRKPATIIPPECNVRSIVVSSDSKLVVAGTNSGIYLSEDGGHAWQDISVPESGFDCWSLALDPKDIDTIYAGGRPSLYRSINKGKTWKILNPGLKNPCSIGIPRITNICFDPVVKSKVWMGVEIDGIYLSEDAGDSWRHVASLGETHSHNDIHGMAAVMQGQNTKLLATTPIGIASSQDDGDSWSYHQFAKIRNEDERSYCRGLAQLSVEYGVVLVGQGDTIPGAVGTVNRYSAADGSWRRAEFDYPPNSLIFCFAKSTTDPKLVICASIYGYVFVSQDAGKTWRKSSQEFGEIRSLAILEK